MMTQSVTSGDDVTGLHPLTSVGPASSRQPTASRDSAGDVNYHAVVGLLISSCLLVVAALTLYLCSVGPVRRRRRQRVPADDVIADHVTPPTAVTSLSQSARDKEVEVASDVDTGLMGSLLGTGGEAVTWYGSRDVQVGRPANVRYISLRHCARQSSSVESDSGPPAAVSTPTSSGANKRLTPLLPRRFGFVGWTRTTTPPSSECVVLQQSSAEAAAALGEASASRAQPTAQVTDGADNRYVCTQQVHH